VDVTVAATDDDGDKVELDDTVGDAVAADDTVEDELPVAAALVVEVAADEPDDEDVEVRVYDDVTEDDRVAATDEEGDGLDPSESVGLTVGPEDPVEDDVAVDAALALDETVIEADCVDVELEVVVDVLEDVCDWDVVLEDVEDGLLLGAAAVP
jgi:hypothetical protein